MAADTPDRILDATVALLRERGLAGLTTRDVAAATGLSRSHLYYWFPNWGALRVAAFERIAAAELLAARTALQRLEPGDTIPAFIARCLPTRRDASWAFWLDGWRAAHDDASFAPTFVAAIRDWENVLAEAVERGRRSGAFRCDDSQRVARQIFAMVSGYVEVLVLQPSRRARAQALDELQAASDVLLGTGTPGATSTRADPRRV